MSRPKMISALAVLLAAGYVAFVPLSSAVVVTPLPSAVVGAVLVGFAVANLRSLHYTRRSIGCGRSRS